MNRARILIVLLVAVVVGGALSYAVYNFLQSRPVTVVRTPEKNVVVALGPLPLGTLLKDEHLKFVSWPQQSAAGYFERKEDLLFAVSSACG
jgi:Flp pilus assembly protein CpaB